MSSRLKISLALSVGVCGLILAGANLPVDTQLTIRTKLGKRTQPHWIVPADSKVVKTEGGSGLIRLFGGLVGCVGFGIAMHLAGTDERQQVLFWQKQGAIDSIQIKEHEATAEIYAGARLKKLQMEAQADVDYHSLQIQQKFREAIGWKPIAQQSILPYGKPGTLEEIINPGDKVEATTTPVIESNPNLDISRQIATKILNSLAGINTSIFLAAPTRCGKTHTLHKWLADLITRFPRASLYVISQKYEDFPGVSSNRLTVFDAMLPEESMNFLDEVYEKLLERKSKPATEETYRDYPVKLILEDWFATHQCLVQKKNAQLWESVAAKLGMIATVGGQYNVGYFICTQSFNIASSGVADSNIRLNLALLAQGLVRTTSNDEEQGSYGVIEQMINNSNVIAGKETRDRLASDLSLLIPISMAEQTPIILSTIGNPVLGLMPKIEVHSAPAAPSLAPDSTDTTPSSTPLLDKAFSDSHQPHHPIPQGWRVASPADITPVVRGVIVACIRAGWGQTKTIQEVFGITKSGNNPNYDLAREVFQQISNEIN
ncbi:hypothetical protein [Microcoleus sp. B3-D7]|uniref:hypothetical protein n=1 Tax=Microcoleus sp. B3-D7 TaxID=2818659 RepID=UPI002FD38ABC